MVVIAAMVVFTVLVVSVVLVAVAAMLVLSSLAVVKATASTLDVLVMVERATDTAKEDVSIMVPIRVTKSNMEEDMVKVKVSKLQSAAAVVLTDPEVLMRGIELLTSQAATSRLSAPRVPTPRSRLLFLMVTSNMLTVVQLAIAMSDMQALTRATATPTLTDAHTGEYIFLTTTTE